jgi:mycothiol synthase
MTDYTWRTATPDDSPAIMQLERACQLLDGRYAIPLSFNYPLTLTNAVESRCALDGDRIIAAAWLTRQGDDLWLRSFVHPEHRGRGIRKTLLRWGTENAAKHGSTTLYMQTESSTPEAEALYRLHGFNRTFAEEVMRRNLKQPLPTAELAKDIRLVSWSDETAPEFYAVFVDAFSERPGYRPTEMTDWIDEMSEGEKFRPDLSLLAVNEANEGIGYVLSELDTVLYTRDQRVAWISQVGVRGAWRGKNIATALMLEVMQGLARERQDITLLHVNVNNPSAIRVYMKLGFDVVGRRARYAVQLQG